MSESIEPINFCSATLDRIGVGATDPRDILASATTPLLEEIDTAELIKAMSTKVRATRL
jgi:hypothetical protein